MLLNLTSLLVLAQTRLAQLLLPVLVPVRVQVKASTPTRREGMRRGH